LRKKIIERKRMTNKKGERKMTEGKRQKKSKKEDERK
jgi:hypothetical protein